MRKQIYNLVSKNSESKFARIYDSIMLVMILLSLLPLFFKQTIALFFYIEKITVMVFIFDYLLRWITADYKYQKKHAISFIKYPFSIMAIIDLLSILPSLSVLNKGFKVLRLFRMGRVLKTFRILKALKYSKNFEILVAVLHKTKESLIMVAFLAITYIVISALVIFNVEPGTFDTFFDAIYWATVSLTTVGYGDIYPVTTAGRIITMISSVFGIAIVALPAGIITAGYMDEINSKGEI